MNRDLVQRFGERGPQQRIATVDQDATIIHSRKQQALWIMRGCGGYRPMLAVWAETGLVLADQFRGGNVPAQMEPLEVAQRAFAALPSGVKEYYIPGRFGLSRKPVDELAAERESRRRTAREDWVRHQCADERGLVRGD